MIHFLTWLFKTWWGSVIGAPVVVSKPKRNTLCPIVFESVPCKVVPITYELERMRAEYRRQELKRQWEEWKETNRVLFG